VDLFEHQAKELFAEYGVPSAIGMLGAEEARHPVVVRLDGSNAAEGRWILEEARIPAVEQAGTMDDAARPAAKLASAAAMGA
jgi:succinyl-CoA synthetase beta subunit